MPFLVETFIPAERDAQRNATRPAHVAFIEANVAVVLAAGAKLADDGTVGDGSFYLLDVLTRAEAESFVGADPFVQAGLVDRVRVQRVRDAFFDRKRSA